MNLIDALMISTTPASANPAVSVTMTRSSPVLLCANCPAITRAASAQASIAINYGGKLGGPG
jgi:hypothetical protein